MADDKFGKLKQDLSKKVTEINIKTSSFFEITKIKTYITTLEGEIEELKKQAGVKAYGLWSAGNPYDEAQVPFFEEIRNREITIERQRQAIQELEEQGKQVLGEQSRAEGSVVCSKCGAEYAKKVNFCIKCGYKMN